MPNFTPQKWAWTEEAISLPLQQQIHPVGGALSGAGEEIRSAPGSQPPKKPAPPALARES